MYQVFCKLWSAQVIDYVGEDYPNPNPDLSLENGGRHEREVGGREGWRGSGGEKESGKQSRMKL